MVALKRITVQVCAALLVACLWGAGVQAVVTDIDPPVIVHTLLEQAYANTNLIIKAQISETTLVDQVRLFFRPPGAAAFYSVNMVLIQGEYRAVIPAEFMTPGVLEYYVQARDTMGNSSYYPVEDHHPAPQRITVVPDDTLPQIELIQPGKRTPSGGYTLLILLYDAAGNIAPDTIRLFYNDTDVTAQAYIADSIIMYHVPAAASTFQTRVRVTVADMAGNQADRTFHLWRAVAWSGELQLNVKNGDWSGSRLVFTSAWGPLDLRVGLSPPSMDGQEVLSWTLQYDARLMHLALGDVVSRPIPAALGPVKHRGGDLTLRLGPISLRTINGHAYVNGDYQRQVSAVKPALDTRFLDLSLTVVKLKDELDPMHPPVEANPKLNYVIAGEGGLAAFNAAIGVRAEASVSLYHDNARGDLWTLIDEIDPREVAAGDDALADVLITLINYLKTVPTSVRAYLELPDVRYGLPKVDLGGKVDAWLPLPWSQLQATAYRYGRSYQTMNEEIRNNREGITASYATIRLFNFLQLFGKYEYQLDNVASLLDLLTHNKPIDRTETQYYAGSVSLGPAGGVNVNLGVEYGETSSYGGDVEQITKGYGLELQNVGFHIANARLTLDAQVKLQDYQVKTDPAADRQVAAYQLRGHVEQGAFAYTLSYGQQLEKNSLGGIRFSAPSLTCGIKLQLDDIAVFGQWPKAFTLQLSGSRNLPVTALMDQAEQRYYAKLNLDAELRLLDTLRFSAGWQYGLNPGVAPQSTWHAGLRWRF